MTAVEEDVILVYNSFRWEVYLKFACKLSHPIVSAIEVEVIKQVVV